jgi:hypothetical protein
LGPKVAKGLLGRGLLWDLLAVSRQHPVGGALLFYQAFNKGCMAWFVIAVLQYCAARHGLQQSGLQYIPCAALTAAFKLDCC